MNKKNKKSVLEKKSFYTALCIILIAVASISWAAADRLKTQTRWSRQESTSTVDPASSAPTTSSEPTESINAAEKTVSDVPYDSSVEQSSGEVQKEEKKPRKQASYFIMPVGGSVYKGFDDQNLQYSETYKDWRVHLGMDIAAKEGTTVFSSADGVVLEVFEDATMGTVVKIDHGGDIIGFYCGLNKKPCVSPGDEVQAGTELGAVDVIPCESVEQAHLHFALSVEGKWVDPNEYISVE